MNSLIDGSLIQAVNKLSERIWTMDNEATESCKSSSAIVQLQHFQDFYLF